ncbi:unnamed protein product [Linum tenue]|uniref:Protein TIFY n=1 Tax=Linum tenue TaxID=586396 RepID=A0AAV0QHH4_9ROSI|nr:unnamed protein product [Linum tenue]
MGRPSCNLELSLHSPATSGDDDHCRREEPQPQPLTIFYNGRYSVCDVTEMQARAIIMLAGGSQEAADDKSATSPGDEQRRRRPASPAMSETPTPPPAVGLSMKRSLQRFLQKRKGRAQAATAAPYSRAAAAFEKKELRFQIDGFQIVAP